MPQHPLGNERWNHIYERIVREAITIDQKVRDGLTADGPPPLHTYVDSDRQVYENLIALRQANSPLYWNDPTAVARLQQLTYRYGPPPAAGTGPFPFPQPGGAFADPVTQSHP